MISQPKVAYGGDKKGVTAKLLVRQENGLVFVVTFLWPYGARDCSSDDRLPSNCKVLGSVPRHHTKPGVVVYPCYPSSRR